MPSVHEQLYGGHVHHVIVSDGPDPELRGMIRKVPYEVLFEELPEHGGANAARRRGLELSTTELIAYLDDDDAFHRQHLEVLVDALERSGADFAYGQMQVLHPNGQPSHVIGSEPPMLGQIGSPVVHRRRLLEIAAWGEPSPIEDWRMFDAWLEAGASWVFVPQVTYDYHAHERPVRSPAS